MRAGFFVIHWFGCILGLVSKFPINPLDTWLATHGYCRPAGAYAAALADGIGGLASPLSGPSSSLPDDRQFECASIATQYLNCIFWSAGMLLGAPISMRPHMGPYEVFFSDPSDETVFRVHELIVILMLKTFCAFEWVQVLAQFVRVYNNLNPDTQAFSAGWDALNRFVSYFAIDHESARELRRYYVERAEEARANSRKRVLSDLSPYLREKFVWLLNKEWLVDVPCFSFVVERLKQRPESGMERYLVQIAMSMQPAVFVPTERPPPLRLYIVTEGVALHRGKRLHKGMSWGAEDVLQSPRRPERCVRGLAVTYLHVLYIGAETFDKLQAQPENVEAYRLTKMWATLHSVGDFMLSEHRKANKLRGAVRLGTGHGDLSAKDVEGRINAGTVRVVVKKDVNGKREVNSEGQTLYTFKFKTIDMAGYQIVKEGHDYRVKQEGGMILPPAARAGAVMNVSSLREESSIRAKLKQLVRRPSKDKIASEEQITSKDQIASKEQITSREQITSKEQITSQEKINESPQRISPVGTPGQPSTFMAVVSASKSIVSSIGTAVQSPVKEPTVTAGQLEARSSEEKERSPSHESLRAIANLQAQMASFQAQLSEQNESQKLILATVQLLASKTGGSSLESPSRRRTMAEAIVVEVDDANMGSQSQGSPKRVQWTENDER